MIGPQDFASYSSSACGIFMVIGSMVLLYKGVITMSQKSNEEAISMEFKNHIKFTSHYPAIALFLMGWAFLFIPMLVPDRSGPSEVRLSGKVGITPPEDLQQVTVRVFGGPWDMLMDSDGSVEKSIFPDLKTLTVEIVAPGRPKLIKTVKIEKDGMAVFGEVNVANPLAAIMNMPSNDLVPVATPVAVPVSANTIQQ